MGKTLKIKSPDGVVSRVVAVVRVEKSDGRMAKDGYEPARVEIPKRSPCHDAEMVIPSHGQGPRLLLHADGAAQPLPVCAKCGDGMFTSHAEKIGTPQEWVVVQFVGLDVVDSCPLSELPGEGDLEQRAIAWASKKKGLKLIERKPE